MKSDSLKEPDEFVSRLVELVVERFWLLNIQFLAGYLTANGLSGDSYQKTALYLLSLEA